MQWLKKGLLGLAVLALVVVGAGLLLPTHYTVSRSVAIQAGTAAIHKYVGDLALWPKWSPWIEQDPSIVVTKGAQTQGPGASQSWRGQSGAGSLRFVSAAPDQGIRYDLQFDGQGTAAAAIQYHAAGGQTVVTWTLQGDMETPVVGGYFALLMDMMVGPVFDRGLRKLKDQVESSAAVAAP